MRDKARISAVPSLTSLTALPARAVHAALHPRASAGHLTTFVRDNARWGWRLGEVVTRRARARASSALSHLADAGSGGMGTEEHLASALHEDADAAPVDLDDPLHLREADTSIDRAAADLEVDVTPLDVADAIQHAPEAAGDPDGHDSPTGEPG